MTLFEYKDYRDFIKDGFKNQPKKGHGQARKIAEYLRVSSTYISQVLSGAKSFTLEQSHELAEYFGFNSLESDYFFYLVQKERAGTKSLQTFCENKLEHLRNQALKVINRIQPKKVLSHEEMAVFYSNAIYSAVHLYSSTLAKGRSFDEISKRFDLSRAKTASVVEFLKSSGLIYEESGSFKMSTQSTHVGTDSPFLIKHLTNWHLRAISAAEDLKETELMYSSNVSLSKKDFEKLREKMLIFIKDFLKEVHESPAEDIACFNLDFFWVRK